MQDEDTNKKTQKKRKRSQPGSENAKPHRHANVQVSTARSSPINLPPALLAFLCSTFLTRIETARVMQCCRAWCLQGANRELLAHMCAAVAHRHSLANMHAAAASATVTQTIDSDSFLPASASSTPGDVAIVDLPWRQNHMEFVQHVLIRLVPASERVDESTEEPLLPLLASLPALPCGLFTLAIAPQFECRLATRQLTSELVVRVSVRDTEDGDNDVVQQQRLWQMLAHAFQRAHTLFVTVVDDTNSKLDPEDTPPPTLALTSHDLIDEAKLLGASKSSSPSLRLHSLIFRTRLTHCIHAMIRYLNSDDASQLCAFPASRTVLKPLTQLFYHSTDSNLPAGLPALMSSVTNLMDVPIGHEGGVGVGVTNKHPVTLLYMRVAHSFGLQHLAPLLTQWQLREIYLDGVDALLLITPSPATQILVLRAKLTLGSLLSRFLLQWSFSQLQRLELVEFTLSSLALLATWAGDVRRFRLVHCQFDDDDGMVDLRAHALSLWPPPPAPQPHLELIEAPTSLARGLAAIERATLPIQRPRLWCYALQVAVIAVPLLVLDLVHSYFPFGRLMNKIRAIRLATIGCPLALATAYLSHFSTVCCEHLPWGHIPRAYEAAPSALVFPAASVALFVGWVWGCNRGWEIATFLRADPMLCFVGASLLTKLARSYFSARRRPRVDWKQTAVYSVRLAVTRVIQLNWLWVSQKCVARTIYCVGWLWRYRPPPAIPAWLQAMFPSHNNSNDNYHQREGHPNFKPPSPSAPSLASFLWTNFRTNLSAIIKVAPRSFGEATQAAKSSMVSRPEQLSNAARTAGSHLVQQLPYVLCSALMLFGLQVTVRQCRRRCGSATPAIVKSSLTLLDQLLHW